MSDLYHVTGMPDIPRLGEAITLVPGPQAAQGVGVYFSEGRWYRSKRCHDRKHSRPRTYHTAGARIAITVVAIDTAETLPVLTGTWKLEEK